MGGQNYELLSIMILYLKNGANLNQVKIVFYSCNIISTFFSFFLWGNFQKFPLLLSSFFKVPIAAPPFLAPSSLPKIFFVDGGLNQILVNLMLCFVVDEYYSTILKNKCNFDYFCGTYYHTVLISQDKYNKTGVINDPLGQTHSLASSEHCFLLFCFARFEKWGRTDGQHVRKQWSLKAVTFGWPSE